MNTFTLLPYFKTCDIDHVEDKTNVRLDMRLIILMHLILSANPCMIFGLLGTTSFFYLFFESQQVSRSQIILNRSKRYQPRNPAKKKGKKPTNLTCTLVLPCTTMYYLVLLSHSKTCTRSRESRHGHET